MALTNQRRYRGTIQGIPPDGAGTGMAPAVVGVEVYVVDGIADIMPCLDDVEARLAHGERP